MDLRIYNNNTNQIPPHASAWSKYLKPHAYLFIDWLPSPLSSSLSPKYSHSYPYLYLYLYRYIALVSYEDESFPYGLALDPVNYDLDIGDFWDIADPSSSPFPTSTTTTTTTNTIDSNSTTFSLPDVNNIVWNDQLQKLYTFDSQHGLIYINTTKTNITDPRGYLSEAFFVILNIGGLEGKEY